MLNKFRNFKYGIKNIIKWWKIIYNDRDYDQNYIYELLYFKFKNMEEFYRSDNVWSAKALEVADELKVVKNLCKRLSEESYLENALTEHDKIYSDYQNNFWNFEKIEGKELYRLINKNKDEANNSFKRCSDLADYLEKQDKELLFTYMNKYIDKWWD